MSKLERANIHDPFAENGPGRSQPGLYHDYMAKWETPAHIRFAQATVGFVLSIVTWPFRCLRRELDRAKS